MRIPLGNFGNVVPNAAPSVQVPSGAGRGAEALQRAAQQASVALQSYADEERQQQQALDRAKAANAVLDREISVENIGREIQQQIADGTAKYDEADKLYKEKVGALPTIDMSHLDPVTAENFSKGLKRADFKGETFIAGVIAKERTADFRRQTDGILDKLGKQAGLPGADIGKIANQIDGMEEIGRRAYGAAWDKRKQDWMDNTWDAQLNQQAMATRDSLDGITSLQKEITQGAYADKLDSNRRNALVAKLDGYKTSLIQRQEAAASRAARQQELTLKKAEAEFNTFQSMADKGTILAPEYVDRAVKMTAGTPYQAGIAAIAQQAQETGGIAAQPIASLNAQVAALETDIARNGRSPALDKRLEQVRKIRDAKLSDYRDEGIEAAPSRGVLTAIADIDLSSPDRLAATLGERLTQAEHVSQDAGRTISPLKNAEAEQLRNVLVALPATQRSAAAAVIAQAVGPRYARAISQQLDSKDRALALAFDAEGAKTTAGRNVSELILTGADAIKDGLVMKDDKKVTGWRATIAAELDGALPDERAASAAKDAAYYIAAYIAKQNGGTVSGSDLQRAVRLAVGGSIIERNGKKLPIPAGMDDGDFEDRLRNVPASAIAKQAPDGKVRVGGVEMPADAFAASIPGQELIYAGTGRYAVVVRGRPVTNSQGRPVFVEVR